MPAQMVEQVTEQRFAVGVAHRLIETLGAAETPELAVVGEHPVAAPELADEGVGVGQADVADIGLGRMWQTATSLLIG